MRSVLPSSLWNLTPRQLPESSAQLRSEVRSFVAEEIRSGRIESQCDSWLAGWDRSFSEALGERSWLGMTIPQEHGGHGRSALDRYVVIEELLAAGAPVSAHWVADRQTAPTLLRFGTEEQKAAYLPLIAQGRCSVAIGMSEPDAGSDLANVRTRAEKVPGGWSVTGTKLWTSGAHLADMIVLLCRTSGTHGDRQSGLSQLLVDLPNPGITIRPVQLMTGAHHFNEVHFEEAFVPDDRLLGEEGNGWTQVVSELAHERSGPERFLSTVPLLLDFIRAAASDRPEGSSTAIGALTSELWAIRQMSIAIAFALDDGSAPDTAAAVVKDLGTQFENRVVETIRKLVSDGLLHDNPHLKGLLAQAILHSPGFTLRGGTNEILRSIIAKEVSSR